MDEKIMLDFMQDVRSGIGRLEESQRNVNEHIKSVSNKADKIRDELQDHTQDLDAHGLGAANRQKKWAGQLVAIIISILGSVMAFYSVVRKP